MMGRMVVKFIAFVLAAVFLVGAAGAIFGIGVLGLQGLYDSTPEERYYAHMEQQGRWIAENCVRGYASQVLGQCPEGVLEHLVGDLEAGAEGRYNAVIRQEGATLWSVTGIPEEAYHFEYSVITDYYRITPPADGEPHMPPYVQGETLPLQGAWKTEQGQFRPRPPGRSARS